METDTVYLTREETAEALGVSLRTVSRYAEQGRLTRYYRGVDRLRPYYDAIQVEQLNEPKPAAPGG